MAIIPAQIRSIDPYDSRRFANTHNLKTRMWTMGNDYIMFPEESFIAIRQADYITDLEKIADPDYVSKFKMTAGLFIKDDVMIHITEECIFSLQSTPSDETNNDKVSILDEGYDTLYELVAASTGKLYFGLKYNYARSLPPNNASFVVTTDYTRFLNAPEYLWLSEVPWSTSGKKIIGTINNFNVYIDGEIVLSRQGFEPGALAKINGGVVYATTSAGDTWGLDWPRGA